VSVKDWFPLDVGCFSDKNCAMCYGDGLEILKKIPCNSVSLIYVDLPYANVEDVDSKYNKEDERKWISTVEHNLFITKIGLSAIQKIDRNGEGSNYGLVHYLHWLYKRIVEIDRVLVGGGLVYLHLGYKLVPYVRTILDLFFGMENFRNEINWRFNIFGKSMIYGCKGHDTILCYSKSKENIDVDIYRFLFIDGVCNKSIGCEVSSKKLKVLVSLENFFQCFIVSFSNPDVIGDKFLKWFIEKGYAS